MRRLTAGRVRRPGMAVALVVLAVLSLLAFAASPALAQEDITGTYNCVGDNAQGGQYKGTVKIAKEGDAYNLTWTIAGQTHHGLGIRTGDLLSCSWKVGEGGGVVVYKIEKNKLIGQWCEYGTKGKVLSELLTK